MKNPRPPRPRSKATLEALKAARRLKAPSERQIKAISEAKGIHWTTLYRALRESA